jgi:signal transduction histidine kinase
MTSKRRLSWPLLFGIATAFGISSSIQSYMLDTLIGEHVNNMVLHVAVVNLVYWYVPAALAPLIVRIATRYQFGRGRGWLPVVVHTTGALAYSVVHLAAMLSLRMLLLRQPPPPEGWWLAARLEYLNQLDWMLMTYLFLVGLAHALEYRRESERRALDSAHLETRLVEAQLKSLERQLQPHFLFNTLNAISGLMRTDVDAADRMMDRLGSLLRMALETSHSQQVALKDELELLQRYLDIEQVRFGSRLSVTMRIDPEVLDAQVPNFLLQPLVENAVRHGIAPHPRPGRVLVEASRHGNRLVLKIADNGEGVASHYLTLLNQGVGLSTTRARLGHLYGAEHSFAFANDNGFCVTIAIPCVVVGDRPAAEALKAGAA